MAYISAVYEDILKIPFFPEKYMNFFDKIIFLSFVKVQEKLEKIQKFIYFSGKKEF